MNKNSKKPVVLSIEDSEDIRIIIKRFLSSKGYQVKTAEDGAKGLKLAKEINPDLILLDIMMPEMNGYEFCTRIQAHRNLRDIPIIFVSAKDAEKDRAKALSLGGIDYLTKPFKKNDLVSLVGKHVGSRKKWQSIKEQVQLEGNEVSDEFSAFKNLIVKEYRLTGEGKNKVLAAQPQWIYQAGLEVGVSEATMAKKISDILKMPYLFEIDPSRVILGILPTSFCKAFNVIPIRGRTKSWAFAVSNPFNLKMLDLLKRFIGSESLPRIYITNPSLIKALLGKETSKKENRENASILVVEDDRNQQKLIKRFLENKGHQVTLANDSVEAFMEIGRGSFELILLDLSLPYMSGLNFLHMKRDKGIHVPVVILTARTEEQYEATSLELGAKNFIRKPLQKDKFLKQIEDALS